MVENLCSNYGEEICSVDGVSYYSFPTIDRLRSEEGVEEKLRSLKFGYRRALSLYAINSLIPIINPTKISFQRFWPCPQCYYSILSALPSLFRAGYIAKAAAQISERGGDEYLSGLRGMKYHEARKELIGLTGIGPKVDK